MCLETKRLFPRTALTDIVVGKWLSLTSSNKVVTYYQRHPVCSLEMKEKFSLFTILNLFINKIRHGYFHYKVEGGMIHSYNLNSMDFLTRRQFEIGTIEHPDIYVKAIIPKGALYYKDCYTGYYASNKLILKPSKKQLKYFK